MTTDNGPVGRMAALARPRGPELRHLARTGPGALAPLHIDPFAGEGRCGAQVHGLDPTAAVTAEQWAYAVTVPVGQRRIRPLRPASCQNLHHAAFTKI
jgi:hypothetical protein